MMIKLYRNPKPYFNYQGPYLHWAGSVVSFFCPKLHSLKSKAPARPKTLVLGLGFRV